MPSVTIFTDIYKKERVAPVKINCDEHIWKLSRMPALAICSE